MPWFLIWFPQFSMVFLFLSEGLLLLLLVLLLLLLLLLLAAAGPATAADASAVAAAADVAAAAAPGVARGYPKCAHACILPRGGGSNLAHACQYL